MEGIPSNFPGGNAANMLQQMSNYNNIQNIPQQQQQPIQQQQNEPDMPKKEVFERLKRRMAMYRKRQDESIPRFDQTFNGVCEQQTNETNVLQKRFLESKAKRVAKKADKKQTEVAPVNVSMHQQKSLKRPAIDDLENDVDQPPIKHPASATTTTMDGMKFSVEIVQQLEFSTSVANLQPQQISTNVTVKTLANGSLKYEQQQTNEMKQEPKVTPIAPMIPPQQTAPDILQQDFKQEPDNEFADLDFRGLANFMANDETELNQLFSNISDVFDQDLFEDKIKQEPRPIQQQQQHIPILHQQHQINQNGHMNAMNQQFNGYVMQEPCQMQQKTLHQQQPHRIYQQQQSQPVQAIPEMSPAAQTLKNMAQQHQVKNSMAMNYMRPNGQPQMQVPPQQQQQTTPMAQRMPYNHNQQYTDYNSTFHKAQMQMPFQPEMIKQEIMMQQQQPMHQMKPQMHHQMFNDDVKLHQQYQQYQNTQFVGSHQQQQQQHPVQTQLPNPQVQQQRNVYNSNQNTMNVHMKQSQMMHIQQNNTGNVQMQGGQHMHFSGDIKMGDNSFMMQQQQNMYFNHHTHQPNTHPNYVNIQNMQKQRQPQQQQQHHHQQQHQQMGDQGPTANYNLMQSQSMSFTQ